MNTILWIGQALLAVIFLFSGINKSIFTERELIDKGQTGVVGLQDKVIHFIGITEILGAVGIVIPWLTGIWPALTPAAGICLAILMLLAAPIHYRLKEFGNVAINIVIFIMAVLVAWGRAQDLY